MPSSATLTRASSSSPPVERHPPTGRGGGGEQGHLLSPLLERDGWVGGEEGTTGGSRFALRSATLTRASSSSPPIEYHPPTGQSGSGEQSHLLSPSLERDGWGEGEGGRRQNPDGHPIVTLA